MPVMKKHSPLAAIGFSAADRFLVSTDKHLFLSAEFSLKQQVFVPGTGCRRGAGQSVGADEQYLRASLPCGFGKSI